MSIVRKKEPKEQNIIEFLKAHKVQQSLSKYNKNADEDNYNYIPRWKSQY
jgi:hypothetical protein